MHSTRDELFIRFARRLANWEEPLPPLDELQQLEFRTKDGDPDLAPSVYEVTEDELVQVCAEHSTQFDPQRATLALDVTAAAEVTRATDGTPTFSLARTRHREVVLQDRVDLHRFIEAVRGPTTTRRTITKQEIFAYAKARLEEQDVEWAAALKHENAQKWLRKLK